MSVRQIVLDTETTGIGHEFGHRIIEIGCLELVDRKLTGDSFHVYLNPQRDVEEGAFKVHGISTEFLQDKPLFKDILTSFLQFVDGAELIIHNAPFDVGFLNAELHHAHASSRIEDRCSILDTLILARDKHPGQRNSLDALCKRYDVDLSKRLHHGALLDAELLAFVYLAMTGGQASLFMEDDFSEHTPSKRVHQDKVTLVSRSPVCLANDEEHRRHEDFVAFLVKKSGRNYWE